MYELLNLTQSEVRTKEQLRQAELTRLRKRAAGSRYAASGWETRSTLVIRVARSDDEEAIHRLAQLDGRRLDGSHLLVAELDGQVLAALPLRGGEPVADPFEPTAHLVEMLKVRAGQLRDGAPPKGRLRAGLVRALRGSRRRPAMAPATPGNGTLLIPRD
jgi:hypothetical protein